MVTQPSFLLRKCKNFCQLFCGLWKFWIEMPFFVDVYFIPILDIQTTTCRGLVWLDPKTYTDQTPFTSGGICLDIAEPHEVWISSRAWWCPIFWDALELLPWRLQDVDGWCFAWWRWIFPPTSKQTANNKEALQTWALRYNRHKQRSVSSPCKIQITTLKSNMIMIAMSYLQIPSNFRCVNTFFSRNVIDMTLTSRKTPVMIVWTPNLLHGLCTTN